jgi:poly(3-hydroxyalkanoate) synthetase
MNSKHETNEPGRQPGAPPEAPLVTKPDFRRTFVALGQRVDLMSIRAPIFLLAAGNDEIVPAGQLFATARLVGTPAEHPVKMTEPCGHLSLFLGAAVLERGWRWRAIARWLEHDLNEPQIDLPRAVVRTA